MGRKMITSVIFALFSMTLFLHAENVLAQSDRSGNSSQPHYIAINLRIRGKKCNFLKIISHSDRAKKRDSQTIKRIPTIPMFNYSFILYPVGICV